MTPDKTEKLITELINKELSYVNKNIEDVKNDPDWYTNNTLTKEQYNEWKEYCLEKFKKECKMTKKQAILQFSMFDLNYGLKVID